jgi:two-component system NarL family sensor kinase
MASQEINDIIDNLSLTFHLGNSSIGIILWNRSNEMIYSSPKAREIFEWQEGEYLNQPFSMEHIVHPDDLGNVLQLLGQMSSGKISHTQSVNRNFTETGRVIWCQWYNSVLQNDPGNVVYSVSLIQEITEQIKTGFSLRASEHELALVFDGAMDPMWVINAEGESKFIFERINPAFLKATGKTKEDVVGKTIEDVMPITSHDLVREKYNEALSTGKIIDYVDQVTRHSGTRYGEIRIIPIRNENGEITRLLGTANDITDKILLQKSLDAERDNLNRQITAAAIKGQEQERAKVSRELHDNVNQVLTTVKLYLELCLDKKVDIPNILSKSAKLLNGTIDDIRQLSKQLSAPSLADMNFRETLRELAGSVRAASEIIIDLNIGLKECPEMDSELHLSIYRIMQEQLTNIIKYAKADVVTISLEHEKGQLMLIISDNGIGFNAGKRTPGLGLTNMRSRASILGGNFTIQSSTGKGTTVIVSIPVAIVNGKCIPSELPKNV